ncbi:hypothetical protein [Klenkia brasiliensis]|uniref:Uncharacterized protein n=1 Tax=Klenkia brasiliensis TaxID=333142 RepID=A0A1G7WTZ7_9ACTN|nr:hypothetical protein [Klenkia brasiliensis]SDG75393.1 hypothetical protein SAMN05660324_3503 [Klenkia brasiliensis]
MAWLVWTVLGLVVGVCLAVGWRYDRDARRRGATPHTGAAMGADARGRKLETLRRSSQQVMGGATPRSQDAHAQTWRRPTR